MYYCTMTIQQAYQQLLLKLYELYDDREAINISDIVIENVTGFRKIDRIMNKQFPLNAQQQELLEDYANALMQHKPVQYVLHEAWFAGMKFYVNENVLIPRPETEELVAWIIEEIRNSEFKIRNLLDIGTGSGCIPIVIKKKLPQLDVHAVDISEHALEVAKQNAHEQEAEVSFHQMDILSEEVEKNKEVFDIIVSNPPYIKQSEAESMQKNVLKHEPHLALFVTGEDALLFYRAITQYASEHLSENGFLFFEINEVHGEEVVDLLQQNGFIDIRLKKDMQGKNRMIKAVWKKEE